MTYTATKEQSERMHALVLGALGKASMCWSRVENAGTFDDVAAQLVGLEFCVDLLALVRSIEAERTAAIGPKFAVYVPQLRANDEISLGAWLVDDCADGAFSVNVADAKWFGSYPEAYSSLERVGVNRVDAFVMRVR